MSTKTEECNNFTHRYWDRHVGLLTSIISGAVALGITLILGSYGYTWLEMKAEQEEKRVWRKDFQGELDKKFVEVKQGQEKLATVLYESNATTKDLLEQILQGQKKRTKGGIDG
jgi:hypothetical protein